LVPVASNADVDDTAASPHRETRSMSITESLLEPATEEAVESEAGFPDRKSWTQQISLTIFLVVPFVAIIAAIPAAWGWGLTWRDAVIGVVMYVATGLGITVGFHRYLTHRSFRAKRWVRVVLAVCGSMAIQGSAIQWVSDHRKHHRFSDKDGDPLPRRLVVRLGEDL
jgi:fatty-acid desaturase